MVNADGVRILPLRPKIETTTETPIPLRCTLGFHPWSRYAPAEPIREVRDASGRVIETVYGQTRTRTGCGMMDTRRVSE